MLDFRIETFLAVCEYMNFTRASEALNITQPAVSQHIRFLEKFYGVKLFSYEGKRPCLTGAGELLRSTALTMVHDESSLKSQMQHISKDREEIRFGATMTIGEAIMGKMLEHFLRKYPEVKLHMEVANTQELLARLDNGGIDFALVEGFFKKSEYDFLTYSTEPYIAVCSSSYPFHKNPECLEDLFGERLLIRESGSGTREVLERYLGLRNYSLEDFTKIAEIGSLQTILELAGAGLGVTFLYEAAARAGLKDGTLKKLCLKDCTITHEFTFIWRKGSIFAERYRALFCQLSGAT